MDEKIKESYERINISEEAKNRIQKAVIMDENTTVKNKIGTAGRWKIAIAACLTAMLVVPTGVHAAQKLYHYFTTSVSENGYSVDMKMKQEESDERAAEASKEQRYIEVTADFGKDDTIEKRGKGEIVDNSAAAWVGYSYKDGFYSGKCFWYELQYLDGDQNKILSTYDVSENEVLTINGRKAVYCKYNDVVGSEYSEDHITDYGQTIYIFVEDYGYIVEMAAQKGLAKGDFINLAEKIQISEVASAKDSSDYVLYSKRTKGAWNVKSNDSATTKIDSKHYYENGQAKVGDTTVRIKDVQVLDSVAGLKKAGFISNNFNYDKIIDQSGRLKTYKREKVKYGDGATSPEESVEKTEMIQPKLVYVTAEFNNPMDVVGHGNYQAPSLQLVSKKGGKIYHAEDNYNRPEYINDAYTDNMPCYFEEQLGGKQSWFAKITGDKMTLHFAYLVDEDIVNGMALCLNGWVSSKEDVIYLDISQK